MGRDPAEEVAQAQYSQIANRLHDLAAELLAGAAYHWASPAAPRGELHARVQATSTRQRPLLARSYILSA